jgi:hypothetical protein
MELGLRVFTKTAATAQLIRQHQQLNVKLVKMDLYSKINKETDYVSPNVRLTMKDFNKLDQAVCLETKHSEIEAF